MPYLDIDNRRISYRLLDNVEKYSGTDEYVVFIHGAGENKDTWIFQEALKDNFNLVFFDLTGHGESTGNIPTINDFINDLSNIINKTCNAKPSIVGHSMGGAIAQKFAIENGDKIKKLILSSTGAKLKVAPIVFDTIKNNFDDVIDLLTDLLFAKKPPKEIAEIVEKEIKDCGRETLYNDFMICNEFNVMDSLDKIKNETLVICGDNDKLTPEKYSIYLKNNIKNSKLSIVKDTGHMVMMEQPDSFNKIVKNFLLEER
jgi:pimeloyl-ACP methyl ester carboxylesterase